MRRAGALAAALVLGLWMSGAAAQLEGSKAWMKEVLGEAGVATARHASFDSTQEAQALAYLETMPGFYVVKTDGLAAGKGVMRIFLSTRSSG